MGEKTSTVRLQVDDEYTHKVFGLDFRKLSEDINQSDIDLLHAIIDTSVHTLRAFPLNSFFAKKFEKLDVLVTELRMSYEYDKYMIASLRYREKDDCLMGDDGTIIDNLHLTDSHPKKTIVISMKEL